MKSRNRIFIPLPPSRVFEVLSDPFTYQEWVVGTSAIRDADEDYPAVGSKLYHRIGIGPLAIRDHTEVLEIVPDRLIVLDAFLRPVGRACVRIEVEPYEDGTRVLMEEGPADGLSKVTMGGPAAPTLLRLRNTESLSRLRRVALRGGNPTDEETDRSEETGRRRVLITGGSSGIGLAAAQRLVERGAEVALVARGQSGLQAALECFEDDEIASVRTYTADVTKREEIEAVIDTAAQDMGGLDAIVTSAAAAAFGPFTETKPEDFEATIDSVFLGTVNAIRASLPHLERTGGSVVVVGSVAGRIPQ
ncbi:MAG: SDR family NAD(P)-dependent oxidoreductase, partial [Actinomycetota bacterium]|nr:SDR family NAD(P)-dependent oxidoreductase [Actinomycetota bacterium]